MTENFQMTPHGVLKFIHTVGWVTHRLEMPKSRELQHFFGARIYLSDLLIWGRDLRNIIISPLTLFLLQDNLSPVTETQEEDWTDVKMKTF